MDDADLEEGDMEEEVEDEEGNEDLGEEGDFGRNNLNSISKMFYR